MGKGAKVAAGAVSAAVVVGLGVLAVPAVVAMGGVVEGVRTVAASFESTPGATADVVRSAPPGATNFTDYSTWSEEDLAAARAEDPNPYVINHPSRFADGCLQNSMLQPNGTLQGAQDLVDMGAREYAAGSVVEDAGGRIVGYQVAAGDAPEAIGNRFCIDGMTVLTANDVMTLHPGQLLMLSAARSGA